MTRGCVAKKRGTKYNAQQSIFQKPGSSGIRVADCETSGFATVQSNFGCLIAEGDLSPGVCKQKKAQALGPSTQRRMKETCSKPGPRRLRIPLTQATSPLSASALVLKCHSTQSFTRAQFFITLFKLFFFFLAALLSLRRTSAKSTPATWDSTLMRSLFINQHSAARDIRLSADSVREECSQLPRVILPNSPRPTLLSVKLASKQYKLYSLVS